MVGGRDLTLHAFLWRAEHLYPDQELVARTHDGMHRYTYAEFADRARQLASVLDAAGIGTGDRVATFSWNNHWHHEAYFGVPCLGAQLHMINILLPKGHVQHIVRDAGDRVVLIDPTMLETFEAAYVDDPSAFESVEQYVVMGDAVPETSLAPVVDYESFVADGDPGFVFPEVDEDQPAGLCYTSGTTGMPKGVEYTHKMYWAHTMALLTGEVGLGQGDVELTIVPMFHVSGWGRPFATIASGAKQVHPGPAPSPADLAGLIESEGVTQTAGVPTVWMGLLEYAREHEPDLSSVEYVLSGGAATPEGLIRDYREQLGLEIVSGYGLTETTPVTHVATLKPALAALEGPARDAIRAHSAGLSLPGIEFRVVDDEGDEVPWDDASLGELWMRGPWVTTEYYNAPETTRAAITDDGWFRTGDIVRVSPDGYVDVVDRQGDLVKSGGEWISSVELENTIMANPNVREAAVVAVPHERWDERPAAFVVPTDDAVDRDALEAELVEAIEAEYPSWWTPDAFVYIEEIPKGSTGKFEKATLREEYVDEALEAAVAESAPGQRS